VDAAATQARQLAEAQAGAEQGGDMVPPEQGKQASSRPASSGVSARRFTAEKTASGSARRLGGGTLRTGLASIAPSSAAYSKMRRTSDRHCVTVS
jgi:hypothetical protein